MARFIAAPRDLEAIETVKAHRSKEVALRPNHFGVVARDGVCPEAVVIRLDWIGGSCAERHNGHEARAREVGRRDNKHRAARAAKLPAERRKEIAQKAAQARKELASLPRPTHTGMLKIGDLEIDCAVLPDGTRVLSQRGVGRALGRGHGGSDWRNQEDAESAGGKLPFYLTANTLKPFISNDLLVLVTNPISYRQTQGGARRGAADAVAARQTRPPRRLGLAARSDRPGAWSKQMMFQLYLVRGSKPDEWKDFAGFFESEGRAREYAKRAIISGYSRAYIKHGFDFVAHLDESSFAPPSKPTPATPKKGPNLAR